MRRKQSRLGVAVLGRPPEGVTEEEVRSALERAGRLLSLAAAEMTVRFAGDATLRRFNRRFRGLDRPTDVLSFPSGERHGGGHLGDLLISRRRAEVQARRAGLEVRREVQELALHGLLHLLGFDHQTDGGEMDRLELKLRSRVLEGAMR